MPKKDNTPHRTFVVKTRLTEEEHNFFMEQLKKHRRLLTLFGVLSGIVYSFIMDIWTVLWYDDSFRIELYLSSLVTALPHTVMYSVSNFIFLWYMSKPFGEKLERIKVKYGI